MHKHISTALLAAVALCVLTALAPARSIGMSTQTETLEQALHLAPRLDHGAEIFDTCAACHGADGWGASDGSVPAIAGQSVPVLVKQIVEFRDEARHSIRMQHFVDRHHLTTSQDLADVAAYVASLPPRQPAPLARSPLADRGAGLYAGFCARCHGRAAQGDTSTRVPRLAAQHPQYLGEQLHDAAEGRRPSMSADHARLLARLSREDIDAISEYLSRIAPTSGGSSARSP
jgi:cytochrome c553